MRGLLLQLTGRAIGLGAIALVAIGLSGVVAGVFGVAAGKSFVAGDPPSVTYTPARCADFFEYAPHARTCEQAATAHHYDEVVGYRMAAGVLGVVILGGSALVRRRRPALFNADRLPAAFDETVAATAFAIASFGLLAIGVDQLALGDNGAGGWLSGGLVAVLAAIASGTRFLVRFARR
jgi:hypothetical protein